MGTSLILKCVLLASGHVAIATAPISEYAMAEIKQNFNGTHFVATVIEGKVNSILIKFIKEKIETSSYSMNNYEQRSLSSQLNFKKMHSSLDCEVTSI
jgi:hypothetical protein